MPPVLLTPVANLPPVWFIPVAICHVVDKVANLPLVSTTQAVPVAKFAAGVFDTVALSVIQCSKQTTGHFFDTWNGRFRAKTVLEF